MSNFKLFDILSVFSDTQMSQFGKFVRSPYFNQNQTLIDLFEYLKSFHPNYDSKLLSPEKLWSYLYPNRLFDDAEIRRLRSSLLKKMEHFIGISKIEEQKVLLQKEVLGFYTDSLLKKHAKTALDNAQKSVDNFPHRNHHYYYSQYLINYEATSYLNLEDYRSKKFQLLVDEYFSATAHNMDIAFVLRKLELTCVIASHRHIFGLSGIDDSIFDDILNLVNYKQAFLEIPSIAIYYYALLMFIDINKEISYQKFRQVFDKNIEKISSSEAIMLYNLAKNYCILKSNGGSPEYYEELLGLYNMGLESGLLYEKNYLKSGDFKNIVTLGTRLGKFEWVEQFIQSNQDKLEEGTDADVFRYCTAYLHFCQNDYDKAKVVLRESTFKDVFFKVDVRKLLLKIAYEEDEVMVRDDLINALRRFINSKKGLISAHHIEANRNFLNILSDFCKIEEKVIIKAKSPLTVIKDILKKINAAKMLSEKTWLLEQIEFQKKKYNLTL
ncbi:MAG: hypothetical protein AB8B69_22910 [Chitinophagales bacterium]